MSSTEVPYEIGSLRRSNDGQLSFIGSSSGVYFINTVRQAFASAVASRDPSDDNRVGTDQNPLDDELGNYFERQTPALPGRENDAYGRSQTLVEGAASTDDLVKALPPQETAKKLATNFFRSWHPFLPFLHGPSFMKDLESVYSGGSLQGKKMRCFVLSLHCVIGVAGLDCPEQVQPSAVVTNHSILMTLLGPLALDNRLSCIQTLLSAQLYLTASLSMDAATTVGGLICRSIVKGGFHRCPYRYPNIAESERDMRKRVFWSAYILDRYLTQAMGHPLGLQDGDVDVCLPSPEERHTRHVTDESASMPSETSETDRSRKEVVLANMIKCARFTGQILEMFHKSIHARSLNEQTLLGLRAEVDTWYNQLPRKLNDSSSSLPSKAFFNISYNHLKLLMNRPFLSLDPFSPVFLSAMQKCLTASRNIIDIFIAQLNAGDGLRWPGYMSCAWMAGLLVAFAAQCGQYPVEHAKEDIDQSLEVLEQMSHRWKAASHCANTLRILKERMRVGAFDTESPDLTEFLTGKRSAPPRDRGPGPKRQRTASEGHIRTSADTQRPLLRSAGTEQQERTPLPAASTPGQRAWEAPGRGTHLDPSATPFTGPAHAMFAQCRQQAISAARTSDAAEGMGYYYQPYPHATDMFQSTDWESLFATMDQQPYFPGASGGFE
ncbi:Activator of stress proteins 1 [Sphaceloma murrayae]|uniref:Activator of stress proteins 1 n=1 Tax=Sphaceloma murrayae TaxID=2082308 RepID=A0A2K1QZ51_9PEZI|nr:Activator of stress proteins 1 [Sphaceloma murrayae]